jgi:hypothetical protein
MFCNAFGGELQSSICDSLSGSALHSTLRFKVGCLCTEVQNRSESNAEEVQNQ